MVTASERGRLTIYIYNGVDVFRQVLILIQTSPVAEGSSEQKFAMSLPTCPAPLTVVMAPVGEKNALHHSCLSIPSLPNSE